MVLIGPRFKDDTRAIVLVEARNAQGLKLLVDRIVNLTYIPGGSHIRGLLVPAQAGGEPGHVIYVEAGSHHGMLGLLDIPHEPGPVSVPQHQDVDGSYDRDPKTRDITHIYLPENKVPDLIYLGTLDHLLQNPNIQLRD